MVLTTLTIYVFFPFSPGYSEGKSKLHTYSIIPAFCASNVNLVTFAFSASCSSYILEINTISCRGDLFAKLSKLDILLSSNKFLASITSFFEKNSSLLLSIFSNSSFDQLISIGLNLSYRIPQSLSSSFILFHITKTNEHFSICNKLVSAAIPLIKLAIFVTFVPNF